MAGEDRGIQAVLKGLPSVHEILEWSALKAAQDEEGLSRGLLKEAARVTLDRLREEIRERGRRQVPPREETEREILEAARRLRLPSLRPVLNATGVLLHTNLGRAPLAREALEAILQVAEGYANLELDLATGKRGLRYEHVEALLCEITGAEAALVVNNNAAAVCLALRALAKDLEVVVSRGELVEIGGSFRIPDILRESGARLVEVGTTNRTHLADYERAIGPKTGLLLKVHPSNYRVMGFHKEVSARELVQLGRRYSLPVMEDLGSGTVVDLAPFGLPGEPLSGDLLREGVDLVTFSGDKLLGGPQAGILIGNKEIVKDIRSHPLNRALRVDKLTLAALEATLRLYRDPALARDRIPLLAMLGTDEATLRRRARRMARRLAERLPDHFTVSVRRTDGRAGGGSFPLQAIPGLGVGIRSTKFSADRLAERLRAGIPPVIARIEQDELVLDVRTLRKGEDRLACKVIEEAFASSPPA